MVIDDLPGSNFCSLLERDIVLKPWRMHHAGATFIRDTLRTAYQIANTVHQADAHWRILPQGHRHSFSGHEFGLRRHDCPS